MPADPPASPTPAPLDPKLTLPPADTESAYDGLPADHPAYRAFADALAPRFGLPGASERLAGGSLPVYALGPTAVVKLYPPYCAEEGPREADVLDALGRHPDVPAPALWGQGSHDGWRWVVMQRLRGRLWSDVDAGLKPAERRQLAHRLGRIAAALHRVAPTFDWPKRTWPAFEAGQRAGAAARQARLGLAESWVAQIDPFLEQLPTADGPEVLLHTELMRQHVFVETDGAGWQISGVFDFEPARLGPAGYELASVGLFVAQGDPALLHAFLDGYGWPRGERTPGFQRRCLGWALLHQYSHLPWYLKRLPAPDAQTLDDLARRWWPL